MVRFFTIFLFFLSSSLFAQTNTQQTGDWSDDCTWDPTPCGGGPDVPAAGDVVNVNHDVVIDQNITSRDVWTFNNEAIDDTASGADYTFTIGSGGDVDIDAKVIFGGDMDVNAGGTLVVRSNDTLIVGDGSSFANGSTVTVEANAVIIVCGDLDNNNNSNGITVHGTIIVKGTFSNGNGGVISGTGGIEADVIDNNSNPSACIFGVCGDAADCATGPCLAPTLPIKLLYFEAKTDQNHLDIEWATTEEINNEKFIVQFSEKGAHWISSNEIQGAGTSFVVNEYQSTYSAAEVFNYNYVRLKQVDFDGNSETFPSKYFNLFGEMAVNVWPNPATTKANVQIRVAAPCRIKYDLVSASSNTLISKTFDEESTSIDSILDLQNLPSGLYFVKVTNLDNGQVVISRLSKN